MAVRNRNAASRDNKKFGKNKNSKNRKHKMENDEPKGPLVNKLIITTREPSKESKKLCTQLRRICDPDCLTKLQDKRPRVQDYLGVADAFLISHIMVVSENSIQIGMRPQGPTHTFKILEYSNEWKNFSFELYKNPPFITFQGKSDLKPIFERLGKNAPGFKRALHISFEDDKIYIRHYCTSTEDLEDNWKMHLREIGPRLTLQHVKKEEGLYQQLRGSKQRRS
ncbi:hypothetical protein ENBRE01_1488 [Enteropsectra breve]|nr:hypothetical protein ENBRE01_1488 [Enteropsectra breve]